MCCLSSYASIVLTASPSTITAPTASPTGSITTPVYVSASGESSTSAITSVSYSIHGLTCSPSTTIFDGQPLTNMIYYNASSGRGTSFTFNLDCTVTPTVSYTVTAFIIVTLYNSTTGQSTGSSLTVTFTVNPQTVTYCNVAESGTYTKNNCATCSVGSSSTLVVPAGTYCSTVSQAAANQLALNYIAANGQSYANTNGTCTATTAITISSIYLDGTLITTGANLVKGTPHTLVVNWSPGVTTGTIYAGDTQSITITPSVVSIPGGSTTATANFWYSDQDSPPAPIIITLTNACGTVTKTLNFYPQ